MQFNRGHRPVQTLAQHVNVARRFQRAIRIDSDLGSSEALEGFVCTQTSANLLCTMANHIRDTGHGAFTWTGPYGTGKSSLSVALSAVLNGHDRNREYAADLVGQTVASTVWDAMPPRKKGWRVLPVVGRREEAASVLSEALVRYLNLSPRRSWNESRILNTLEELAAQNPRSSGGLIVFIDEMGKLLESAAQNGSDIYLLQQIAELASRSSGRLIVVGILHQTFAEYANRLSSEIRDEWVKIQGRFIDLVVDASGEEQIELVGRSIEGDPNRVLSRRACATFNRTVKRTVQQLRTRATPRLASLLYGCWPLHPIVACLLGPLSRRRFGQNQRSIFGFLNSVEPYGFQEFLSDSRKNELYGPDNLWDYLRVNLEPSILASPDGHRWALGLNALERCDGKGAQEVHLKLLKTIVLLDLVKDRSNLYPNRELLSMLLGDQHTTDEIRAGLETLQNWSMVSFRQFSDSYVVYEGSDFDIDEELNIRLDGNREVNLEILDGLPLFHPIVAKRHYHETGTLRWFDIRAIPLHEMDSAIAKYDLDTSCAGAFLLGIPVQNESIATAQQHCQAIARANPNPSVVIGVPQIDHNISAYVRDLQALQDILRDSPALLNDRVARVEIESRIGEIHVQLESSLAISMSESTWYISGGSTLREIRSSSLARSMFSEMASKIADTRFKESPRIHSELLNRAKLSTSAAAGRNALLRRMVAGEGIDRLGIDGFPAEAGLFESVLETTGLYIQQDGLFGFVSPKKDEDPCNLWFTWETALDFLKENRDRAVAVSEVYELWRRPPIGMKDGMMPVLLTAFLLSNREELSVYREGVFLPKFTDLDIEYLVRDPNDIQFRWVEMDAEAVHLLTDLANVVKDINPAFSLHNIEPLDVARGLVAIYDGLPSWVQRTQQLSGNAKKIRHLLKRAHDPNRLIFDDIQDSFGTRLNEDGRDGAAGIVLLVREGLAELSSAYPSTLSRILDFLLSELQVPNSSSSSLMELRSRAENVREVAGEYREEAFILRLASFSGTHQDIESLAGLAIGKLAKDWVDQDIERIMLSIAELARKFLHLEMFAHVKGRNNRRRSLAVIVGNGTGTTPLFAEFSLADSEKGNVERLRREMHEVVNQVGVNRHLALAALAQLSADIISEESPDD